MSLLSLGQSLPMMLKFILLFLYVFVQIQTNKAYYPTGVRGTRISSARFTGRAIKYSNAPLQRWSTVDSQQTLFEVIATQTKSTLKRNAGKSILAPTPIHVKILGVLNTVKNFFIRQFVMSPFYAFFYVYFIFSALSLLRNVFSPMARKVGTLSPKRGKINLKEIEELKKKSDFDIYECEVCKMELRPAKGRAQVVLGKPHFRCPKCGAKADKFFNIFNMNDERAKARWERIKEEEARKEKDMFQDPDEE